ncbi:MAG: transcription antitermination factor NusB [Anaerolineaceae bacterium]|nr:transcription antitermination factor NusB [Anaerolineaceae bacterium]
MKQRTKARGIALQILYEIDIANHNPVEVLEFRLSQDNIDEQIQAFTRKLVLGIVPHKGTLDNFIAQHAPEWPLNQVAIIDLNILRIALWEFCVDSQTPLKVAINEAIELAKLYGSDSSSRFVNGVLGSLANRQEEIQLLFKEIANP